MELIICVVIITISIWHCDGVSIQEQLEHIAATRKESLGIRTDFVPSRRDYDFHLGKSSFILGAPSMVSHLPEAEPILPGHTLIRPALDMLKSAIKFPHKDMDDGAGVYGNIDNLSIKWDGRSERVLHTGFRRMNDRYGTMTDFEPPRRNDGKEKRLLLFLLRGDQAKMKRLLEEEIYKSIYPYKGAKQNTIKIPRPRPSTKDNKLFKNIMEKMRNEMKKTPVMKNLHQRGYSDKSNSRRQPRAAAYAFVNLDNINELLRSIPVRQNVLEGKDVIVLQNSNEDSSDNNYGHGDMTDNEPQVKYDNVGNDSKLTWFWNSKDTFNHIKINPEAPELNELIPSGAHEDNSKKWWFYHEADFEPFGKLD